MNSGQVGTMRSLYSQIHGSTSAMTRMGRIGAVARATGASERLLRYCEQQGLLTPTRLPSGYREYGEADVAAVRNIRALLAAGLPGSALSPGGGP
jgi:MerR HTH family regulatory protein